MSAEESSFSSLVPHFSIELDKSPAVFFAGEEIKGRVYVHVKHDIQIRGLFLQIRGDSNVHWTEKTHYEYRAEPKHFRNYQQCVCWTHFFLGNPRIIVPLPRGAHVFEFSYLLPNDIPSSFEGNYGNVRYFLMAQLDWPSGQHFQQRLLCITVNSLHDLNQLEGATCSEERFTEYHQKLLRWTLKTILSVPRRGFVPGQTVLAFATVDNRTLHRVKGTKAELIEVCRYLASGKERITKRVVASEERGGIPRSSKDTWAIQLDIPPIPPSGLVFCRIIHLEYYIKLTVKSGRLPKQKLQVPLIIGSVPLKDDIDQFEEGNDDMPSEISSAFGRRGPSVQFAESVWGGTELNTNQRRVSQTGNSFTPAYVTYRKSSLLGGAANRTPMRP